MPLDRKEIHELHLLHLADTSQEGILDDRSNKVRKSKVCIACPLIANRHDGSVFKCAHLLSKHVHTSSGNSAAFVPVGCLRHREDTPATSLLPYQTSDGTLTVDSQKKISLSATFPSFGAMFSSCLPSSSGTICSHILANAGATNTTCATNSSCPAVYGSTCVDFPLRSVEHTSEVVSVKLQTPSHFSQSNISPPLHFLPCPMQPWTTSLMSLPSNKSSGTTGHFLLPGSQSRSIGSPFVRNRAVDKSSLQGPSPCLCSYPADDTVAMACRRIPLEGLDQLHSVDSSRETGEKNTNHMRRLKCSSHSVLRSSQLESSVLPAPCSTAAAEGDTQRRNSEDLLERACQLSVEEMHSRYEIEEEADRGLERLFGQEVAQWLKRQREARVAHKTHSQHIATEKAFHQNHSLSIQIGLQLRERLEDEDHRNALQNIRRACPGPIRHKRRTLSPMSLPLPSLSEGCMCSCRSSQRTLPTSCDMDERSKRGGPFCARLRNSRTSAVTWSKVEDQIARQLDARSRMRKMDVASSYFFADFL